MKYKIKTRHERIFADTTTPVAIYLRLRDIFPNSLLLESSEYQSRDNNISYICCRPVAGITLDEERLSIQYPGEDKLIYKSADDMELSREIQDFRECFELEGNSEDELRVTSNGLFGYFTFDCITHFEDIELHGQLDEARKIPFMQYHVYQYVIAIDHFHNELHIFEHFYDAEQDSELDKIRYLIQNKNFPEYSFSLQEEERSSMTDEGFVQLVDKMKAHIYRGDVFQIVPSRAFSRQFTGDEFNVYRALRAINPSPYLFYFDYGDFRLFGSSPESQLTIKDRKASIYPIAGTFKRTGRLDEDREIAKKLQADPKENAEHVMLVDLARNDLSKYCRQVHIDSYKEPQYYSHVIHLVSKVSGILQDETDSFDVVAATYPAGTLSGAPKHRAIQLIDEYEPRKRGFYSGGIGFMGFDGEFNHAIMIRSFLSKQNTLHYQAGAGIVADSVPESELHEVDNKIAALRKALEIAETLNK